jgi:N-acetylglucosaminyldiphosphoundecaprenol N-acetyl-beta-D-mannosaminyltransferase
VKSPDAAAESEGGRRRVGSIRFTVLPLRGAIDLVLRTSTEPQPSGSAFHFANAYNIALADSNINYRQVLDNGDYVFTDGTPVVWAGRRLHRDLSHMWERVYGPDVMEGVFTCSSQQGPRHYLLGGSEETLERLVKSVTQRWPEAVIVGFESPPFRSPTPAEYLETTKRISRSGATCVWVGLGTPKQDYEVHRIATSLNVCALAIGAAFDFISGSKSQAPEWMQRSGLEWAYRLFQEPRRMWRRYLWGNPRFIFSVLRQIFVTRGMNERR